MLENPKHEHFCRAYVANGYVAKHAAEEAGYSKKCSHNTGPLLLERIDVQIRIEELKSETLAKLDISREAVIREMARVGMYDIRKIKTDLQQVDDDTAAAIEGVDIQELPDGGGFVHKFRMAKKMPALKALGDHFNIFEDHQKAGAGEINVHISPLDEQL